jgi:hypothetical protein
MSGSICAEAGSPTHIFADCDAILNAVCDAWNRFIAEPDRIVSIGSRQWARIGQD